MRWLLLPLLACTALLAACSGFEARQGQPATLTSPAYPHPSSTSPAPQPSSTPNPSATPTPDASPMLAQPGSTPRPERIRAANTAQLELAHEVQYKVWELVLDLAWSPSTGLLAVAAGEHIHLYATPDFKEILQIPAGGVLNELAFQPKGSLLAGAGQDGSLVVWDVLTGEMLYRVAAHKKAANTVVFSQDGALIATGGNDGMARLWASQDGSRVAEMIGGAFAIPSVSFAYADTSLAIANAGIVRLRNITTQRFVQTLRGSESILSIAIAPQEDLLAAATVENRLLAWDLQTGEQSWEAQAAASGPERPALAWQVAFSPDGSLLASASGDGSLALWDAHSGQLLQRFSAHSRAATCVAFSPDGYWLASGGLDGALRLWAVRP